MPYYAVMQIAYLSCFVGLEVKVAESLRKPPELSRLYIDQQPSLFIVGGVVGKLRIPLA